MHPTLLLSIEELPFVQSIGYEGAPGTALTVTATGVPPAAPQPLDIGAVPVTTAPLPPFPYLAFPDALGKTGRGSKRASFDAVSSSLVRTFDNRDANMSAMAIRRNYEAAVKGLGAVKVNTITPDDKDLIEANGETTAQNNKLRFLPLNMRYDSYVLRTRDKTIWMALMFADSSTRFVVVEEKAMQQSVTLVTADTMRTELAAKGHIPLYINFDTDNSGIAAHNVDLSRQRAEAVVRQLVAGGIDAARLQAAGKGAAAPLADNKDEAGRAKNRRVELVKL